MPSAPIRLRLDRRYHVVDPDRYRDFTLGTGLAQRLQAIQFGLMAQVDTAVAQIEATARGAFAHAITGMFGTSLWIILLGFLVTLFIPVIPLQDRHAPAGAEQASGSASVSGSGA